MGCNLSVDQAPKSNLDQNSSNGKATTGNKTINREILPTFLKEEESENTDGAQFLHNHSIQSLCATDDGVWIVSPKCSELVQMDNEGERARCIEMVSGIEGISMSPLSGRLWMCCDDSTIREMTVPETVDTPAEPAQVRFDTGCMCICVTYNEYIVVGTYMDVTIYSQDGEVVLSTQNIAGSGVVKPYKVAACKKTRRIAVADWDDEVCGGENNPNIGVFNDKLELQHRYRGETKLLKKRKSDATKFIPYDLCYDPQGMLLVVDYKIRCINVIDSEGSFLRLLIALPTVGVFPLCISLHSDQLWVGCSDKSLKVYKYTDLTES